MCHRKFGIGADGVILLRKGKMANTDFEMVYINPDGSVTFCGNGSRCAIHFAWKLGMINGGGLTTNFLAPDGPHTAYIVSDTNTVEKSPLISTTQLLIFKIGAFEDD